MRELPTGPDAVLLDFSGEESSPTATRRAAAALRRALDRGELAGVTDIVPSAHTVLVQARPGHGLDDLGIRRALRRGEHESATGPADEPVVVPVTYDGADLADVASALGISTGEVIALHTRTRWRVQFMGFAPGFGYLVPDEPDGVDLPGPHPFDAVGRRSEARTRVPRGAVAIAAGYSAIYPDTSPGGWQLLGHTDIRLWDETAEPPALLAPGRLVRFARFVEDSST